jgi:hypothetical protein
MCTIYRCAFTVLRLDWETLARLASYRSKLLHVNVCPRTIIIHPSIFKAQTNKPPPLSFEAQTKKLSR